MSASQTLRVPERPPAPALPGPARWHPTPSAFSSASASTPMPVPKTGTAEPLRNVTAVPQRRSDHGLDASVYLPFLAPMLCGVRVRASRRELEFVLPNPSGGRGVYVAAWSVVTGFAAPTLHDTLLVGRLSGRASIGPADVRQAARSVALEGYAGVAAAEAAGRAQAALEIASLRLRAQFLLTLAGRAGFVRPEDAASCLDPDGFNIMAGRLGWRGPLLAEALGQLSLQLASVAVVARPGLDGAAPPFAGRCGRWGRLLSLTHRLRLSLAEEQFRRHGPDAILLGRIVTAADRCIRQAEILLPEIETALSDPLLLLEAWRDGRERATSWMDALETAFEGWDRICLLWFDARSARARQALLPELASLSRAGGSADGWTAVGRLWEPGEEELAEAAGSQPGRVIERNERIRARELTLELEAL